MRYALQLRRPPEPDSDAEDGDAAEEGGDDSAKQATPSVKGSTKGRAHAAPSPSKVTCPPFPLLASQLACCLPTVQRSLLQSATKAGELTSDWGTLGELEYVLRLCMLEVREEMHHYLIKVSGALF